MIANQINLLYFYHIKLIDMRYLVVSLLLLMSWGLACGNNENTIVTGAGRFHLYLPELEGKRVGLLANHTSVVGDSHLADTLIRLGVDIKRIFSPEHGFRGTADAGEKVENGIDPVTGIPVISLYGAHREPSADDLSGIDIMLFDLQDVGTRFYTYISTLQLLMEKCAELGIAVIVLDRPNPNGFYVDGPILDMSYSSFVGMQPVPAVYGMTIGEYALMLNGEGWLKEGRQCILKVIGCDNYTHSTEYYLPVGPSPNLPNQVSVYLYPSLCFFEGTVVSCGRGTPYPFQLFGHPDLGGYTYSFTPIPGPGSASPVLSGRLCYGLDLTDAIERGIVPSPGINLDWLIDAYNRFPEKERFFNNYFNTLAGGPDLRMQIEAGYSSDRIKELWQPALESFRLIRKKYLLYDE